MTVMVDLLYDRPPILYTTPGRPPIDAWDLQIAAPPPLVAWLDARHRRGHPSGIYGLGAGTAATVVAEAFPLVGLRTEHHRDPGGAHAHVHVMLAARGPDGQRLDRGRLVEVATEAWIAHVQRMVDYAHERPHLGLRWRPDGAIEGVDHSWVPPFRCAEFDWLDEEPVFPDL